MRGLAPGAVQCGDLQLAGRTALGSIVAWVNRTLPSEPTEEAIEAVDELVPEDDEFRPYLLRFVTLIVLSAGIAAFGPGADGAGGAGVAGLAGQRDAAAPGRGHAAAGAVFAPAVPGGGQQDGEDQGLGHRRTPRLGAIMHASVRRGLIAVKGRRGARGAAGNGCLASVWQAYGKRRVGGAPPAPRPRRMTRAGRRAIMGPLQPKEAAMAESVYKLIEIVGTSSESWDKAAAVAVERAGSSLRDLRVAEVTEQDVVIENGKVSLYRTKLKISLKLED